MLETFCQSLSTSITNTVTCEAVFEQVLIIDTLATHGDFIFILGGGGGGGGGGEGCRKEIMHDHYL